MKFSLHVLRAMLLTCSIFLTLSLANAAGPGDGPKVSPTESSQISASPSVEGILPTVSVDAGMKSATGDLQATAVVANETGTDVITALVAVTTVTNVSTTGGSDGSITLSVTGTSLGNWNAIWTSDDPAWPFNGQNWYFGIVGLPAGTYTVVISDFWAPTNTITESYIVTEPAPPPPPGCDAFKLNETLTVVSDETASALNNGGVCAYAEGFTGLVSLEWSYNYAGTAIPFNGICTGFLLAAGTYTVTMTDSGSGCTFSEEFVIEEPGCDGSFKLDETLTVVSDETASALNNGGVCAYAEGYTGLVTLEWSFPYAGTTTPYNAICTGFLLASGTYTVTMTDVLSGCTFSSEFVIEEPACTFEIDEALSVVYDETYPGLDNGGICAYGKGFTGGYTAEWSFPYAGTTTPYNALCTGFLLASGTYTVTMTDILSGCTFSHEFVIEEPVSDCSAFKLNETATVKYNETDPSLNNGGICAFAQGYVGPVALEWSYNYAGTTTPYNGICTGYLLAAGTYTVTMTDTWTLCTFSKTFVITEPSASCAGFELNTAATVVYNETSAALNNGGICAVAQGYTGLVTLEWSYNFAGTTIPYNGICTGYLLSAGTYTVTMTDYLSGCTFAEEFVITEPGTGPCGAFQLDQNLTVVYNETDAALNNGGICAYASGYTGAYTAEWSYNYAGTSVPYNGLCTGYLLAAGTYTVTMTDILSGCTFEEEFEITEPGTGPCGSSTFKLDDAISFTANETNADLNNGGVCAYAKGYTGPYTLEWSFPYAGTTVPYNGFCSGYLLEAGTYTVTMTDLMSGCTFEEEFVITEPTADCSGFQIADELTYLANETDPSFNNGGICAYAEGYTGAYSLEWSFPYAGTSVPYNGLCTGYLLAAGTYTVTMTDILTGCTFAEEFVITEPSASCANFTINEATTFVANETDAALNNGGICAYAQGFTGAVAVEWSYPYAGTSIPYNGYCTGYLLAAGTYTVTMTDVLTGCTIEEDFIITEPAPGPCGGFQLDQNATVVYNETAAALNNGGICAYASGYTGAYTLNWSYNYAGTSTPYNGLCTGYLLAAGTYTVTMTDILSGCTFSEDFVITEPAPGPCGTFQVDPNLSYVADETAYVANNGGICAYAQGATGPYTLEWSFPYYGTSVPYNGFCSGYLLEAGTYTVTMTDLMSGCTAVEEFVVNQPDACTVAIPAPVQLVQPGCNGANTGFILLAATSSALPITYKWSNFGQANNIAGLAAGTYTVTATDAAGCSVTKVYTLTSGSLSIVCSGVNATTASNGSVSVVASGSTGYTYLWSTGATTSSVSGLPAGTYSVIVTDAAGCSTTCMKTITGPASPVVVTVAGTNATSGNNGGATASVSGGTTPYTYSWSNGATTPSITGLAPGTYTVTVTDGNGVTSTSSVVISGPVTGDCNLGLTTLTQTNAGCGAANGFIWVAPTGAQGAVTYKWSNYGLADNIAGLTAGTYTVTVTDAAGCTFVKMYTITGGGALNVVCSGVNATSGSNGSVSVAATGGTGYTYLWSTGATTAAVTGLGAGTYTVIVTDASGCSATCSKTITGPTTGGCTLAITTLQQTNAGCGAANGFIWIAPTGAQGAVTYKWSNYGLADNIAGLTAGTYTVTVTDAAGCTAVSSYAVTGGGALNVVCSGVNATSGSNGSVSVAATGGTGYTYLWSTGATTATVTGLGAGTYTVIVTDASGCSATCMKTITGPTTGGCTLALTTVEQINASCGAANGFIWVAPTGAQGAVAYQWSNYGLANNIAGLTAGTYTVTATDAAGCSVTKVYTITGGGSLMANCSGVNATTANNGSVSVSVSGGVAPYTYLWSNGIPTSSVSNLAPGTYSVIVTDANGCVTTCMVTITGVVITPLTVDATGTNATSGSNGSATATTAGGTGPYTYLWSNGATTQTITGLAPGTYTVTVTDANGQTATDVVVITGPTGGCTLAVVLSQQINATCGANNGLLSVNATGAQGAWTANWSNFGLNTNTIGNLAPGYYTVTVTDAANCAATSAYLVTNTAGLNVNCSAVNATSGNNGSASSMVSGGVWPYTYVWSNGASTSSISNLAPGVYTVIATDANGCSGTCTSVVSGPGGCGMIVTMSGFNATAGSNGSVSATVTGAGAPYTYLWSNGGTTSTISGLGAGTYTVTVTNAAGCPMTGSYTITGPNGCTIDIAVASSVVANVSCNGLSNGKIILAVKNPQGAWSAVWSNGATGGTASNLTAGTYTVTVTDAAGCTDVATFVVTQPTPIVVSCSGVNPTNGLSNGSVTINMTGGTAPYYYYWYTGAVSQATQTGLPAGTYTAVAQDANHCKMVCSTTLVNINTAPGLTTGMASGKDLAPALITFPNPTDRHFTIDIENMTSQAIQMRVVDMLGKVLETTTVLYEGPVVYDSINLATGTYVLHVICEDGTILSRMVTIR
jgi:SprB repeat/Secretion system C-terminal sorting domain